jgi:hypothetical protein
MHGALVSFICSRKHTVRKSDVCIPRKKLRGLVPDSYIHVSVSDLCILSISMQQNRQTDHGNI